MHPAAEWAILLRQDCQVEVVRHEAEAQDGHGNLDASMGQGLEEGLIVALLVKDLGTAVAAVDHVIANPTNRSSRSAWHKGRE